jgi:hypothetical protein
VIALSSFTSPQISGSAGLVVGASPITSGRSNANDFVSSGGISSSSKNLSPSVHGALRSSKFRKASIAAVRMSSFSVKTTGVGGNGGELSFGADDSPLGSEVMILGPGDWSVIIIISHPHLLSLLWRTKINNRIICIPHFARSHALGIPHIFCFYYLLLNPLRFLMFVDRVMLRTNG